MKSNVQASLDGATAFKRRQALEGGEGSPQPVSTGSHRGAKIGAWLRPRFDLHKLSSSVRPAVRELETLTAFFERFVRAVAVAHHRAFEVLEQLLGRRRTTARMKLVHNRIGRKNSPSHDLTKAEGAQRAVFERSAELMRERDRPTGGA